ncbi:uncharacterized protein LOC127812903 isoform X2 [Diospyros lotus]|uniref:uncharacterized protein LOC127812903 isoform X2 n=1 Tax=Diospyros lotus TaxID=55363 RepID=UPI0022507F26|nr:uncharacterized protein LOC127812903 isoform X2 [Diospyros lotus]
MDDCTRKKAVGGLVNTRKGSDLVLRDTAESKDGNAQFCNRLGCNGRLNHTRIAQNGCSIKLKSSISSLHASSGKEIIGSSSRTSSTVAKTKKYFQESQKKQSSQSEAVQSETSSVQDEQEVYLPGNACIGLQSALNDVEPHKVTLMEAGSSSMASNGRPQKVFWQKSSGVGTRDAPSTSSASLATKSISQGARNSCSVSRYGLRNLRCNSASDVIPSGGSSSQPNLSRRKDILKKRDPKVEGSSSVQGKKIRNPVVESSTSVRGKKLNGPLSGDGRSSISGHGISISDTRQSRNWSPSRNNGVGSVRTQRLVNGNTRTRLSNQGNGNHMLPTGLPPQVPLPESPCAADVPSSSNQFLAEASSSHSSSCSHTGSSSGSLPGIMQSGPIEFGIPPFLMNRDGLQQYNMYGIAEVLLALERIEQDEELTYEQFLALETNLFLGGLGIYDQHRDMRLDIDNMSYEELLALEEKMGTVSTALSEEALSKCLQRSIYQPAILKEGTRGCGGVENDVKCSICQVLFL